MKVKRINRSFQATFYIRRLMFLAIPIGLIFLIVSGYAFSEMRIQNDSSIKNSIDIYEEDLSHKLDAVAHFVQWTVVHEHVLEDFNSNNNMGDYRQASEDLRARVGEMQYAIGNEFQYFFFSKENELFINASSIALDYATYQAIKDKLIDDANKNSGSYIIEWTPCQFNNNTFLYYCICYKDYVFASAVDMKDVSGPLSSLNLGKQGCIQFESKGDVFFATNKVPSGPTSLFYSKITITDSQYDIPFTISIYMDVFSHYGHIFFLLFLIFLLALIFIIIMGIYILFTYRKIILPIKLFSDNLAALDSLPEDSSNANEASIMLSDNNIQELNQINRQFKNLTHEITRLKINIYEAELEKNNFLIHFLQQQIKPHFYLNCLTTIDSMLSIGETDTARKMLSFTSKYLRYLFQADQDFINLSNELAHIEDYINIQNLRLANTIKYEIHTKEEYSLLQVPPLLLITFVENIIKHAIPHGDTLYIRINCEKYDCNTDTLLAKYKTPSYFEITILDNGQGLNEEIIEKINSGVAVSKDGQHLGLSNSLKRLELLYENRFELILSNHDAFGAKVILHIPYTID